MSARKYKKRPLHDSTIMSTPSVASFHYKGGIDSSARDTLCSQWVDVITLGGAEKQSFSRTSPAFLYIHCSRVCVCARLRATLLAVLPIRSHATVGECNSWPSCKTLFHPLWGRAGLLAKVSWSKSQGIAERLRCNQVYSLFLSSFPRCSD